jgi:hypothetical protein
MEDCDVRKVFAIMLVVAPLLAACGKAEEPLIPELKGRWDLVSLHKMQEARGTVGSSNTSANASKRDTTDNCNVSYVTFGKQRISMRVLGIPVPVFQVADVNVRGQRVIITGGMDSNPKHHGKLVLVLRNGGVSFDDIFDERGRSIKYERIPDGHTLRSKGATTLGEAMELFLELKPCKT